MIRTKMHTSNIPHKPRSIAVPRFPPPPPILKKDHREKMFRDRAHKTRKITEEQHFYT